MLQRPRGLKPSTALRPNPGNARSGPFPKAKGCIPDCGLSPGQVSQLLLLLRLIISPGFDFLFPSCCLSLLFSL